MPDENQIISGDAIIGKTIAAVRIAAYDEWAGLRFTDGTFIILHDSVFDIPKNKGRG